ncbi:MAG: RNA 2',3'-cyclic phosphodiesterase [Bdellovibrionales bacterium]
MSRYFIAVVPDSLGENPALKHLVGKMKRTLSDREREVRWVAPALWHVTLQFLGELPIGRKDELMQLMHDWNPKISELNLRLQGLGGFPASDQARILWLGVQENQQLLDLQTELGQLLKAKGFEIEAREYNPHLTLARLRNPQSVTDLVGLGGRKHFGDYKISELIVFESVLQGNIVKYMPQLRRSLQ